MPEKEEMNLNESVSIVIESFNSSFKEKNLSVEIKMDRSSPLISADRSQMEQVFSNLIKNSVEATSYNGHITVSTSNKPVTFRIEDNGTGLSKEVSEKLFTPFFSTKPGGQGIGLTLVQEILTNHGFSFSFRNKDSAGTEFIIKFNN
jgi:signal transduction histidine kinase